MRQRAPADFSREFAGYMADAAAEYVEAIDASHADPDNDTLAEDAREFRRHLVSAIYEWRKREERAQRADRTQAACRSATATHEEDGARK